MRLPDLWRGRFSGEVAELLDTMQANAEKLLGWSQEHDLALEITRKPKGVPVRQMTDTQRDTFSELLDVYLARLPDKLADQQKALVAAEMDQIHFGWAGSSERHQPHYYRIQGRRLLIEYDNTQRGANHIHTVWRDLENDFGGDALARHYAQSAH